MMEGTMNKLRQVMTSYEQNLREVLLWFSLFNISRRRPIFGEFY